MRIQVARHVFFDFPDIKGISKGMKARGMIWLYCFIFAGCGHGSTLLSDTKDRLNQPAPTQNSPNPNANDPNTNPDTGPSTCPTFLPGRALSTIESSEIVEASGIVASRQNNGVFWVHNDGDDGRLFALSSTGRTLAIYAVENLADQDWEDIAIGPGPISNQDYLYIGDIGSAGSLPITIYRLVEPVVNANQALVETNASGVEQIHLIYPDDDNYNAETLLVDPANGDIYIVTKTGERSFLFRQAAPHQNGETATLEQVATIDLSNLAGSHSTTGGDITSDGKLIVIRTYSHAHLWLRPDQGTVASAFATPSCLSLTLIDEPLGEAIAFTAEGNLITTSEGRNPPLYIYEQR